MRSERRSRRALQTRQKRSPRRPKVPTGLRDGAKTRLTLSVRELPWEGKTLGPKNLLRRHVVRRVHIVHVRVEQRLLEDVRPADRRDVHVLVRLLASNTIQQLPAIQLRRRRIKTSSTLVSS